MKFLLIKLIKILKSKININTNIKEIKLLGKAFNVKIMLYIHQ